MQYCDNEYLNENPIVVKKLMDTAVSFSELSKCAAKKVCCILYKDGNIISIGINGTTPGSVNCCDKFKKINGEWYYKNNNEWIKSDNQEIHSLWSSYNEIHAELNAISKALVPVTGSVAFITHSPCPNCAKSLVAFGIRKIYFRFKYDDYENVKGYLEVQNIELVQI